MFSRPSLDALAFREVEQLSNGVTADTLRVHKLREMAVEVKRIVDLKLYKTGNYTSLEAYFNDKWSLSRAQVYRLVDTAYVYEVSTSEFIVPPLIIPKPFDVYGVCNLIFIESSVLKALTSSHIAKRSVPPSSRSRELATRYECYGYGSWV